MRFGARDATVTLGSVAAAVGDARSLASLLMNDIEVPHKVDWVIGP